MDRKAEKEYWDRFYLSAELIYPSPFAEFCQVEFLKKNEKIIDLGCGTGRDTLFFFKKGHQVVGIDQSGLVISQLQRLHNDKHESLKFIETDFTNLTDNEKFDIVYSFANDSTIDDNTTFNFEEYIQKISFLLSPDGLLIFESQALDVLVPSEFDLKLEILEKYFIIKERRTVHSEYPVNVSERIFLILEKK